MLQTSNTLYALRVAKGSEILAFENSTGSNDKRQSELQSQRMRERKGQDQSGVVMIITSQQHTTGRAVLRVHGTAVNHLRARKEIDTLRRGGLSSSMGFQCVLPEREPLLRH